MNKIQKAASVAVAGAPDAAQLAKINAFAKTPLTAEEVYVFSLRLCDDQPDRDYERFATAALPELAKRFIGKTGIADHDWSADRQVARIFDAYVETVQSVTLIRAWAYCLRTEKNADLIREIDAGIKKEVSVGCAMGGAICSICGASYGACEHRKGQTYGQDTCYAVLCDPLDAYEFSFVAVPAQPEAGVLKMHGAGSDAPDVLEKDAALGRQYRKSLEDEVVKLGLTLDFGLDEPLLRALAGHADATTLALLREGLAAKVAQCFPPAPQLGWQMAMPEDDSAFLV